MRLFNSETQRKEEFVPVEPGKVRMYACGPTVYNFIHVGNARPIIMFDVLRRYLEYRGYKVKFVQNFTDVDDKIIKRANEEGVTSQEIAEKYIEEYWTDAHGLGVRDADVHPRATQVMPEIIAMVETLIEKGYVYIAESPLYEINTKDKTYFAYDESERADIMKMIGDKKFTIQRSKGLGENEPDMMSLTTMNPETRRLIQVTPDDAEHTKFMFDMLLGDNLSARKEFINNNGHDYLDMADIS